MTNGHRVAPPDLDDDELVVIGAMPVWGFGHRGTSALRISQDLDGAIAPARVRAILRSLYTRRRVTRRRQGHSPGPWRWWRRAEEFVPSYPVVPLSPN